tara:strand:+ start:276797 stop:278449 length:1653 start_codon:yes stop_codon:yes gene_type:complete
LRTFNLLIIVSLCSAVATAQPSPTSNRRGGRSPQLLFQQFDKNADGRVSREETDDAAFFDRVDTDADGFITRREATSFAQRDRPQETQPSAPVFPANTADVAAKRSLLAQIDPVVGKQSRPPNVVLILADDLGYADTATYGSRSIPTPHIDRLASAGAKLTDAYVTAASCSPSRAGLISGRYQQRFGFEFNTAGAAITHRLHRGLDPAAVTLADVMQSAGYRTAAIGKWHLGTRAQFHPLVRGFDEFYGFLGGAHSFFSAKSDEPIHSTLMRGGDPLIEPEYLTDAIARETVNFIEKHADQPFFAYVPFNAVHTPIEATKKYQDRFPDVTDPTRRDYYAMTSALDDAVGNIIAAVADHDLTDNTLVIFVNDNGGPTYTGVQSNEPLKLGKLFLFEGGVRVPMLIKWPNAIPAKQVFGGTTSTLDLFPTIAAAAGIDVPTAIPLDGVNLLPYLTGERDGSPHETLFWSNGPNTAVRHGDWKLVCSGDSKWLYDLSDDLGETKNLAESHAEKLQQLQTLLRDWQEEMLPPKWPSKAGRRVHDVDGQPYEQNI